MIKNCLHPIISHVVFIAAFLFISFNSISQNTCTHQHHQVGFCAVSPTPYPFEVVQPDGSKFIAKLFGSPAVSYLETEDGYVVLKDTDGFYKYATEGKKGRLEPSGIIVSDPEERSAEEVSFLENLKSHQRYTDQALENKLDNYEPFASAGMKAIQGAFPSTGTNKALLLLIDYPDQSFINTVSEFDDYCNLPGYNLNGSSGSFRDYYQDISYDSLTINTDVEGWYTATNNQTYYGYHGGTNWQASRELVKEAVDAAEAAGVDFSQYDNDGDGKVDQIMVIHSGNGREASGDDDDIWSHKSTLGSLAVTYDGVEINAYIIQPERYSGSIANIGVFCHEFGHALGLPDLYDTDGSSSGLGSWCLMAGGTWNNNGKTPAHMSAWCKQELGWMEPDTLMGSGSVANMDYSENSGESYRMNTPVQGEYFLLENRQKEGWDAHLDGEGLAIWHIDESISNNTDEWHPKVSLRQADGLQDLQNDLGSDDGDLYTGSSGNTVFDDTSTPSSDTYDGNSSTNDVNNIVEAGFVVSFDYSSLVYPSTVTRGPYLQSGTTTSAIIKWRTSNNTDSKVWYGDSPTNLNQTILVNFSDTLHEVTVTGLTANTTYYYAVGDSGGQMEGANNDHYFKTAPAVGTSQPITAWVLGDCGTGTAQQEAVRDAYYNYIGSNHTDMVLLLGDNAYQDGFDSEYKTAIFDMYPDKLKNSMLWSCPGNHDYYGQGGLNADYYDIFSFPKNAEAGGVASNTEKYYSFDYGNIHIISLDSHDENRSAGSPMLTWLENDLSATTQDWIVVIFHHPPYSKGSHDSDNTSEYRMIEMRENVLPICEDYGVDLILNGHSHAYERSKLINGHYGFSSSYDPATHDIDGGDGRLNGDGVYQQNATEEGTVYIVTGSAGKKSSVGSHPIMYYSVSRLGSTILEVDGPQMNVKFLNDSGLVEDYLSLVQSGVPTVSWTSPYDGQFFANLDPISLNADASDKDGNVTQVEFFVDGVSVGTDVTAPYSLNWTPSGYGNFTLEATATDNDGNTNSSEISITVQNGGTVNISAQINNGNDDVEEKETTGSIASTSTDLELVYDTWNSQFSQTVGMRFNNLNIPMGATITNAYIQFTVDESGSATTNLTIQGEDHDNAPPFSTSNFDVSNRTTTTTSVNWSPVPWTVIGEAGTDQQTPDLSAIVQEIVNRPGWTPNNSMVLTVTGTGTGKRTAESYDGVPSSAPVLHISYDLGVGNSPPTVNWTNPTNGQNFADLNPITFQANASDSDGNVTQVEFFVDGISVGTDLTAPYSLDWTPTAFGNYLLKVVATDDESSTAEEEISISVQNSFSISVQINNNDDDVEEKETTGQIITTSTDLELVYDTWNDQFNQTVGLRFNSINIPTGSVISNAYIQFTSDETQSEPTDLTIHAEDIDDSPAFSTVAFDVSSRTTTTASVNWQPVAWTSIGAAGADQQTPDITAMVQEIIDRPGWAANNSISFIITGTGHRTADSHNGSPANAPTLYVTYSAGGNPCDPFVDDDNDGACSDVDCNDNDATVYPGATEVCDGIDNNCDGNTDEGVINTYYADTDNDGYGDANNFTQACTSPSGYVVDDTDCDDNEAAANPGATEVCDGIDNNCDGNVDEGLANTYYADTDNDGYGDANNSTQACTAPSGYVSDNTDCDDTDLNINSGATEICDGIDNNCDGNVDEGLANTYYADTDNDGYGDANNSTQACTVPSGYVVDDTDCDDTDLNINPGAIEVCDGIDNNCDGNTDEGVTNTYYADTDNDGYGDAANTTQACSVPTGYVSDNTDCDDNEAAAYPSATEICDGIDNNCDGNTDEGVTNTYYADTDNDGYGDAANTTQACSVPTGYVSDNTDCDDNEAAAYPGATEVCDGIDNNCDGNTDEGVLNTYYLDLDSDGYGDVVNATQACSAPTGFVADNNDCDDSNPNTNPGAAEICDGIDNNCDGNTDEGVSNTYYADTDTDGYGDANSTTQACTAPSGYVSDNTDCDDNDAAIYIGATCDDGDPNTSNDVYDSNCVCVGTPVGCTYQTINDWDFESGWGIWNDGGSDARRSSKDAAYANSGVYCVRLRDNTSTSVMTTDILDLSDYEELTVDFSYYVVSFDNSNEDFWLQISTDGGSTYTTEGEWNLGDEFNNNEFKSDQVVITGTFTANTILRFRCDASGNNDKVYIDDIVISGCLTPSPNLVGNNNGNNNFNAEMGQPEIQDAKVQQENALHLFPNPVRSQLNIHYQSVDGQRAYMELFDQSGKRVQFDNLQTVKGNNEFQMDLSQLPAGLYFFRVIESGKQITKRVMISN